MVVPQQKAAQNDIFSNRQHLVEADRNMEHCMHTIHSNALNITLFSTAIESYIIAAVTKNVGAIKNVRVSDTSDIDAGNTKIATSIIDYSLR